jgi:hypothetical protein
LLETVEPLCTLTLRFTESYFQMVTVLRTELGFRHVLSRCRAYQQFLAGDLLFRSFPVTHCNTQKTSTWKIHWAPLPLLRNLNLKFGSTRQGYKINDIFLAGDQNRDTTGLEYVKLCAIEGIACDWCMECS